MPNLEREKQILHAIPLCYKGACEKIISAFVLGSLIEKNVLKPSTFVCWPGTCGNSHVESDKTCTTPTVGSNYPTHICSGCDSNTIISAIYIFSQ